jgi:hypothetical protein
MGSALRANRERWRDLMALLTRAHEWAALQPRASVGTDGVTAVSSTISMYGWGKRMINQDSREDLKKPRQSVTSNRSASTGFLPYNNLMIEVRIRCFRT